MSMVAGAVVAERREIRRKKMAWPILLEPDPNPETQGGKEYRRNGSRCNLVLDAFGWALSPLIRIHSSRFNTFNCRECHNPWRNLSAHFSSSEIFLNPRIPHQILSFLMNLVKLTRNSRTMADLMLVNVYDDGYHDYITKVQFSTRPMGLHKFSL